MSGTRLGIVTGGVRGIGLAISSTLLDDGVVDELVALDRDPVEIDRVRVIECDVTDQASIAAAFDRLGEASVHVLVNNAGGGDFDMSANEVLPAAADWQAMLQLNLTSAFLVTKAALGSMSRGSAVCNIASGAALVANPPFLQPYGVAKAGLVHWTTNLAVTLAKEGIRVNAVAPGFVWTDLVDRLVEGDRATFDAMATGATKLGMPQTGADIANAVSFLCSDRAAQVTGHVIPVDGGASIPVNKG